MKSSYSSWKLHWYKLLISRITGLSVLMSSHHAVPENKKSGIVTPVTTRFSEFSISNVRFCCCSTRIADSDTTATMNRRMEIEMVIITFKSFMYLTSKVWHRLPAARPRLRDKACRYGNHSDSERVAGCPAPPCSASCLEHVTRRFNQRSIFSTWSKITELSSVESNWRLISCLSQFIVIQP